MSLKSKIQQLSKTKKGNVFVDRLCKRTGKTVLGGYNRIGFHTDLTDCEVGLGSYCGKNCSFVRTKIGKFCSIGANVEIVYNNHPTNFVTTYMFFFDAVSPYSFSVDNKVPCTWGLSADGIHSVVIGNDVWIGNGAKIRGGLPLAMARSSAWARWSPRTSRLMRSSEAFPLG